jgi:hypothetical protein
MTPKVALVSVACIALFSATCATGCGCSGSLLIVTGEFGVKIAATRRES